MSVPAQRNSASSGWARNDKAVLFTRRDCDQRAAAIQTNAPMPTTPSGQPEGSFDLQVNGYAGVDFNKDDLTPDELHHACERLRADGVGAILATVITEDVSRMALRLANLVKHRAADPLAREMIPGIHIEGPFLNETPGYRGAHPADAIHPANIDEMERLLDAAGGLTRVVTLAPERDDGLAVTNMLC